MFVELIEFIGVLDQRASAAATSTKHFAAKPKNRLNGIDSDVFPPTDAPAWCISETWKRSEQDYDGA